MLCVRQQVPILLYSHAAPAMKTLLVLAPGLERAEPAEQRRREAAGECPQDSLFEDTLNADVMDGRHFRDVRARSLLTRVLCRLVPKSSSRP